MGLSLRGQTSGAIDINAPAVAGDNTITLPGNNGSANQFYKNSGTAGIVTHSSMVEDSSGNIGIGTDNPSDELSVVSSLTTDSVLRLQGGTSAGKGSGIRLMKGASAVGYIGPESWLFGSSNTSDTLVISQNAQANLSITSAGNIGINETTPDSKVDIVHSTSTNTATENLIHLRTDPSGSYASRGLFVKIGRDGGYDNSGAHYDIVGSAGNSGFHVFEVQGSEKLRITSDGTVLMGGQTASYDGGFVNLELRKDSTTVGGSMTLVNDQSATAGATCQIDCYQNFRGAGKIVFGRENANNWQSSAAGAASFLAFYTNNAGTEAEKLRITSGGFVGINDNNPGMRLCVKGTVSAGAGSNEDLQQWNIGSDNVKAEIKYIDASATRGMLFGTTTGHNLSFQSNNIERVRIISAGYVQIGSGYLNATAYHRINGINASGGEAILVVSGYQASGGTNQDSIIVSASSDSATPNSATSILRVFRHAANQRSINAAGSVNASGTDYAEYMVKSGNFTIVKGDICGVNSEGKLTNVFADSISFVVKSTNPSYVGGDTWHTSVGEAPGGYNDNRTESEIAAAKVVYDQNLETARNTVDRIAFAGQVPVNVQGTNAGQYIVPITTADGGITGEAKNEADLTLVEYMRAVGKVIAIEDDGRALIIVKIS